MIKRRSLLALVLFALAASPSFCSAENLPAPSATWSLDNVADFVRHGDLGLADGVRDRAVVFDGESLHAEQMAAVYQLVTATHEIPEFAGRMNVAPDPSWTRQVEEHARQDRTSIVFDGKSPDRLACDTTLRKMPDGSWVMVMLGGGDKEPDPRNQVFITRSHDEGRTWESMSPLDFGFPRQGNTKAMVPSELMVHGGKCKLFFATHGGALRRLAGMDGRQRRLVPNLGRANSCARTAS